MATSLTSSAPAMPSSSAPIQTGPVPAGSPPCHPIDVATLAQKSCDHLRDLRADVNSLGQPSSQEAIVCSLRRMTDSLNVLERIAERMKAGGAGISPQLTALSVAPGMQLHDPERVKRGVRLAESSHWLHQRCHEFAHPIVEGISACGMLKRSHLSVATKRKYPRPSPVIHCDTSDIRNLIPEVMHSYPDLRLTVVAQTHNTLTLHVKVSEVMQTLILFRGAIIEHAIVRGLDEEIFIPRLGGSSIPGGSAQQTSRTVDLFTPSRHIVFQKLSDYAITCLLNFFHIQFPQMAAKSYFLWLNSYRNLFSTRCAKCGRILLDGLPPTQRNYQRFTDAFHEYCRN